MQFPITIGLHRSRFLDVALLLAALSATGVTVVFKQSTEVRMGFVLLIWMLCGVAWRQMSPKLSAIRLERTGQIFVRDNGESKFLATRLMPGATVHPWLTVIRLKTDDGQCYTLIATVDSLNRQNFRCLRVFLRWQAEFNGPDGDA